MTVKDLKIGKYFTIVPIVNPKESQVFIRGEYDRSLKRYVCGKFSDASYSRLFKGDRFIYTDFIF